MSSPDERRSRDIRESRISLRSCGLRLCYQRTPAEASDKSAAGNEINVEKIVHPLLAASLLPMLMAQRAFHQFFGLLGKLRPGLGHQQERGLVTLVRGRAHGAQALGGALPVFGGIRQGTHRPR
jgi:hypothetical protein